MKNCPKIQGETFWSNIWRIEEEKLVKKKLNKGIKVEIDTKKEETRLTNPERQMKHEKRLSLFLTDSHGK